MKATLRIVDCVTSKLIETHEIEFDSMELREAYIAVEKVMSQWMEEGDHLTRLETHEASDGRNLTPYVIDCGDGEVADIFGQLFWDPAPVTF